MDAARATRRPSLSVGPQTVLMIGTSLIVLVTGWILTIGRHDPGAHVLRTVWSLACTTVRSLCA